MVYESFEKVDKIFAPGTYLVGFEFDGTACFRKGAKLGPDEIRNVSDGIESYSPYLDKDLLERENLFDLGNLRVGNSNDHEKNWLEGNKHFDEITQSFDPSIHKLATLGGEHSISYAPIKKYLKAFNNLTLLHLDAHADLRDGYLGFHYSHASIIRRVVEHFGPGHELIQYGIRSGTKDEYKWMSQHKTLCRSLNELVERLLFIPDDRPIYLTFDLDFFDPGILPGTGTPEPGGDTFHSFIKISKILAKKNFVGADIVELAPDLDKSGVSSVVATKVVRELILAMD